MFQLNKLNRSGKKRKRIGRGGNTGGTSTRGHKGQGARSGGPKGPGFEGGQMPLIRRLPRRGFNNMRFVPVVDIINLAQLEKNFSDDAIVDKQELIQKGLVKARKGKAQKRFIKILGSGELTKKLTVTADAFSASAKQAIEKTGGQANVIKEM